MHSLLPNKYFPELFEAFSDTWRYFNPIFQRLSFKLAMGKKKAQKSEFCKKHKGLF